MISGNAHEGMHATHGMSERAAVRDEINDTQVDGNIQGWQGSTYMKWSYSGKVNWCSPSCDSGVAKQYSFHKSLAGSNGSVATKRGVGVI